MNRHTEYRGFAIDTQTTVTGTRYMVAFTFYSLTSSVPRLTTKMSHGTFRSNDEAHAAGVKEAEQLIDGFVSESMQPSATPPPENRL